MSDVTILRIVEFILIGDSCLYPFGDGLFGLEIRDGVLANTCFSELGQEGDAFTETVGLGLGFFGSAHGDKRSDKQSDKGVFKCSVGALGSLSARRGSS